MYVVLLSVTEPIDNTKQGLTTLTNPNIRDKIKILEKTGSIYSGTYS